MTQKVRWILAAAAVAAFAAGDQSWKDKQVSEWSDDDVKEVLTSSPWARMSVPEITRSQDNGQRGGRRGGMGGGGIGIGGGGIGTGGGGWGGRGGGYGGSNGGNNGGSNGGYGQQRNDDDSNSQSSSGDSSQSHNVTVRWESALPVQDAILKSKETGTPSIDDGHYAIAVVGVPNRIANNSDAGKPKAELKREGKKTIKSTDARVIAGDKGTMVMFLFPRSQEITATDKQVSFEAHIGRMHVTQSFYLSDMIYRGKLEL